MTPVGVVVPTYNEAANLPRLVRRLLALGPEFRVVCVDDASPDGTGEIAVRLATRDPRVKVIQRVGERGYASASKEGIRWCLEAGCDAVVTLDADLSHDPSAIPLLLRELARGADVVVGSRYVNGGCLAVDWGLTRRLVSRGGSAYARLALGVAVHDCTSGFRCYKASTLRLVRLEQLRSEGYGFLIELLAALKTQGAVMTEVPITYVDRKAGASKISKAIILEALFRTTVLAVHRLKAEWEVRARALEP
jgi:dolichol-phosphate mannosyltransferase